METEFETKILDVDVASMKQLLEEIGATFVKEKFQQRYVYDFTPVNPNSWVRLRTDGSKTTLTVKEIHNDDVDGTKELEVSVDNFDVMHVLLQKLGYQARAYQENKRTSYTLDGVDIEIDEWPMIPPYVEVEGKSVEQVETIVKLLGHNISQTTAMNTTKVYAKYGINLNKEKELRFK